MKYPYEGKPSWSHTNIGLHLKPAAHHTDWLGDKARREYEIGILTRIHANWCTWITDGDSAMETIAEKPAPCWLLDEGIVPITRDSTTGLPLDYQNIDFVLKLVAEFKPYGLRPAVILWNEPGDYREWHKKRPTDWKEKFLAVWIQAARQVMDAGANAGFPDPLGKWSWFFERLPSDIVDAFRDGRCFFSAHLYGKNRPVNYPEDDVSRYGTPLTETGYRVALDDFWDVPGFRDFTLGQINEQRKLLANRYKTFLDDTTCFGAWRNVYYEFERLHGFRPVTCMNEGGWVPKDRPGSGENVDYRWPMTTPKMVARLTVESLKVDHGMFALTPWISYGWSDNGWYNNGSFSDVTDSDTGKPYGPEMPVIAALKNLMLNPADELVSIASEIANRSRIIRGLANEL